VAKRGMVYRLRRGLADLLAPERHEPLALVAPIGSAAPPASPVFEDQLKAMLQHAGHRALLSGRVNFIGLQKVKERYGSGWERVAVRAERMARTIIERHLVSGDIYTSINGLTFVIVFASLTPEQAKVKCLAIADAITKALLGEQGGDLLEIKTAVTRVDGTLGLESISFTDRLCASLEGAEELQFTEPPARAPPPALPAAPPPAGKAPPPALPAAPPPASPAPPPAGRAPRSPRLDPLANLRFLYRPIWDRPRNVVSGYLCAAQVLSTDGSTVLGDAEALIEGDADERARLDERIRERALRDLATVFQEGRKLLVTLPVHFETLCAVGRRRDYLAAVDRELVDGAAKYLMIEIAGVPAGVPQARLVELTAALRGQCRGVLLSLPVDTPDLTSVKGSGATAVGCDVSGAAASEAVLMQQMNRFSRAADKAGFPSYVHGARSLSRVVTALGAGFNYIDGSAVASPIDHPRGIVDFHLDDIYRAYLKA
jgi:hypothetical protein